MDVIIGNNVTTIMDSAFKGCSGIKNLVFGINIKVIGDYCFKGCCSITDVNLPEGVTTLGTEAFAGCTSVIDFYVPSSVVNFGDSIALNCTGVLYIDCDTPNGEKTYTSNSSSAIAFASAFDSSGFNKIVFGNNVSTIGVYAFSECRNLKTIEIGYNVKTIGNSFITEDGYGSLTTVYVKALTPPELTSRCFHYWSWSYSYGGYIPSHIPSDLTIYVPKNSVDMYKSEYVWDAYTDKIIGYDF